MIRVVPAIGMGSDLPVRVLAVAGAVALGALLLGGLVQLVVKLSFAQRVPPWILWGIRVLGGVVCGWLVSLWLFGGGGGGIGGSGGWGLGGPGKGGGDKGTPKEERKDGKKKDKEKDKKKKEVPPTPPSQQLAVEVLGNADLKKIAGDKYDLRKRYRVPGEPTLRPLEEIKKLIFERRDGKTPLRELKIVLYRDSPAQDKEQVTALVEYVEDLGGQEGEKLKVSYSVHRDQDAPVE